MDKAMELLEKLAAKIGTTTSMLWTALVKQAGIDGVGYLVLHTCTLLFILATIIVLIKAAGAPAKWERTRVMVNGKPHEYMGGFDWDEHGALFGASIALPIISVIMLTISLCTVSDTIACFLNPEYVALMKILKAISPVVN